MSPELIIGYAEKSVVGAGFFYLLYYNQKNSCSITNSLKDFGNTLVSICSVLTKMDMRLEQVENRITRLEER